jgi:hypothetical protein
MKVNDEEIYKEFNKNYCFLLSKKFNVKPATIRKSLARTLSGDAALLEYLIQKNNLVEEMELECRGAWMNSEERIISKQFNIL